MAKKKRRRGKSLTQTAFKFVRLGALVAPAAAIAVKPIWNYGKLRQGIKAYFGYDIGDYQTGSGRGLSLGSLAEGWGAYVGACLATYGIPKLVSIIRRL